MDNNLTQKYKQQLKGLSKQLQHGGKMISPDTMKSIKKKIDTVEQLDNELNIFLNKLKKINDSGVSFNKCEISEADINYFNRIYKRLSHNTLIIENGLTKISSHV